MNKDVIKAIRKCGTPMTNSKFWSKAALTEAARKAKANACVHFLTCLLYTSPSPRD